MLPSVAALKLSEGYIAVGRADEAARIKLDSAVKLHEAQRTTESRDLLKPPEVSPHFGPLSSRFQRSCGKARICLWGGAMSMFHHYCV